MSYLENAVIMLDNVGVADILVPFFLVFTIVFAVLQKTRIFGHEMDKKNINVVPATGCKPILFWMKHWHQDLLTSNLIHFTANNISDFVEHPQSQRSVAVNASHQLSYIACLYQ